MVTTPLNAICAGMESAAGDELARLPPRLARPCTAVPPMTCADSASAGKWRRTSASPYTRYSGVAAPTVRARPSLFVSVLPSLITGTARVSFSKSAISVWVTWPGVKL